MVCSMSHKGDRWNIAGTLLEHCWNNAPTERFFDSLKREWLTRNVYTAREAAEDDAKSYMVYYNTKILHTTLNNQTPMEFELCAQQSGRKH